MNTMSTYYDPEDTMTQEDRCERLAELGDSMRDRFLDDFNLPSGGSEKPPVAKLPADADTTLWGVGVSDAAGGYTLTDTADTIGTTTESEDAAYNAEGEEYARIARALLTRCFNVMTGREINACQIATGDLDTDEGFNANLLDLLAIQYSKEISEHRNQ